MEKINAQLIKHEGLKLKPYRCTEGKLTIGVGRNLEDRGITEDEALYLLNKDVLDVTKSLSSQLHIFDYLDGARKGVLINMAFNIGVNGLLKFKCMIAALNRYDYDCAADEMIDSKWADQVGNRSIELANQMRTGEWQL